MPFLTPSPAIGGTDRVRRVIDVPAYILPEVTGALSRLLYEVNWEKHGTLTVEQTLAIIDQMWATYISGQVLMIGQIVLHARSPLPQNLLPCDGATHLKSLYPLLYDALAPIYRIDANTFRVPDLRDRFPGGQGATLGAALNATGGNFSYTIPIAAIPAHTHGYNDDGSFNVFQTLDPSAIGTPGVDPEILVRTTQPRTTAAAGGGNAVNVIPRYVTVGYAIVSS